MEEQQDVYEVEGVVASIPMRPALDASIFEFYIHRIIKGFSAPQLIRMEYDYYADITALIGKKIKAFTYRSTDENSGFATLRLVEYEETA